MSVGRDRRCREDAARADAGKQTVSADPQQIQTLRHHVLIVADPRGAGVWQRKVEETVDQGRWKDHSEILRGGLVDRKKRDSPVRLASETPEATAEHVRQQSAVGVVPANQAAGPAERVRVPEDRVVLIEAFPGAAILAPVTREAGVRRAKFRNRLSQEKRGQQLLRHHSDRLDGGKDHAGFCQCVQIGQREIGLAMLEDLIVGELIQQNPDDTGRRGRGGRAHGAFERGCPAPRTGVHGARLWAE